MPYYETSQEWLRQSALLLQARPSTTRITTTYHQTDKTGTSKKRQKRRQQKLQEERQSTAATAATATTTPTPTAAAPRASLTIKTYDPHTGVCLKYRTTKAAEVSRLILSLGQLGKNMAALPTDADVTMPDAAAAEDTGTPGGEGAGNGGAAKVQTPAQGGGKGKKKRGKK